MQNLVTKWHNPSPDHVHFELFQAPGFRPLVVDVPPGGEVTISSEYDHSIQKVRSGRVVGGLAPRLVRSDAKIHPKMHSSLLGTPEEIEQYNERAAKMAADKAAASSTKK